MRERRWIQSGTLQVLLLAVGIFVISTSELLPMGLLPDIGRQYQVTVQTAGWLVTAYALGVVVGGPLLTVITARASRKRLLLYMLALFGAGSLLSAAAPSFGVMIASRVVSAVAQGAFFGAAVVMAGQLAAPGKEASAISLASSGLTVATVIGGPLGTLLGQQFGWRFPFWMLVIMTLLVGAGILWKIPDMPKVAEPQIRRQLGQVARTGPVLALFTTVFGFGGVFLAFTYISPILQEITELPEDRISIVLLLFGLASVIGNAAGGKLADRRLHTALLGSMGLLLAVMVAFYFTSTSVVPALITIFLWGAAGYAMVTPLNVQVLRRSGSAQDLASTLNISAFNLGNALGAFTGGYVVESRLGLPGLPLASAAIVAIGLAFAAAGVLWDRSKSGKARVSEQEQCVKSAGGASCGMNPGAQP
jgi:DHA1 family inner membrane transport protein